MNNNSTLKELLSEYEQKRHAEFKNFQDRKQKLYKQLPELEKIDNDINSISIKSIQSILTSHDKSQIDELKNSLLLLKNKKINLLKEHGYSLEDFSPKYECEKCKDTGFVKSSTGTSLCSCIKQKIYNIEYNNSNIYDLKSQNFDNFNLDFYSNEINFDKYNKNISPKDNIISIKKICLDFVKNFNNTDENNLLFCGNTGLGKTFLSSCIANEIIKSGKTVLYQTAPIMLDSIIDYKFGKTDKDIVSSIYSADLLIVDDLGTESRNNLKITELFNIINSRLLNQNNKITKTIISTNLSLQDLYSNYEERIVSRIIGNYNACYFFGDDIRLKKKISYK